MNFFTSGDERQPMLACIPIICQMIDSFINFIGKIIGLFQKKQIINAIFTIPT